MLTKHHEGALLLLEELGPAILLTKEVLVHKSQCCCWRNLLLNSWCKSCSLEKLVLLLEIRAEHLLP